MTKRELRVSLASEDLADPSVAQEKLRIAIASWIEGRRREERPLDLMLLLRLSGDFDAEVESIVESVLFDTPEVRGHLKGRVVSVSIRSDDAQMPIRGGSFVVE